jgi:hypothetical protein
MREREMELWTMWLRSEFMEVKEVPHLLWQHGEGRQEISIYVLEASWVEVVRSKASFCQGVEGSVDGTISGNP